MLKTRYFSIVIYLVVIIAALHFLGLTFYLYWILSWFDIVMHFLGGAWVAITVIWLLFFSEFSAVKTHSKSPAPTRLSSVAIISAIIVGVGWEIFEYTTGVTLVSEANYATDTASDLLMDIIGAFSAALFVVWNEKKLAVKKLPLYEK